MSEDTLIEPQLEESLNNDKSLDLIIIGAGPAGMSAALCAARADVKFVLFDIQGVNGPGPARWDPPIAIYRTPLGPLVIRLREPL